MIHSGAFDLLIVRADLNVSILVFNADQEVEQWISRRDTVTSSNAN